jgi:UDP-N-acetylmuramate dehydrogenase
MDFRSALEEAFGAGRVGVAVPLAGFTTLGVGGTADFFVETRDTGEVIKALEVARAANVPVTVIGGGSNLLVADDGVRGLVVRLRGGTIEAVSERLVRADAGVTLNALIRWTLARGRAGLEAWVGTPGTIGGAIHGNAHYGGRVIGDLIDHVRVAGPDGSLRDVARADMAFGYDSSRLQATGEVLLWAVFDLAPGASVAELRKVARGSLARRRQTQPLDVPTAGCVFRNPDPSKELIPAGVPPSAGALIDRAGLKGNRIGGASVSATHANFIVNDGGARAADILSLMRLCQREVFERFGVRLCEEIVLLGDFDRQ